jgi:predicted GNAT family acetyltransferase
MSNILHNENEQRGIFYIKEGNKTVAELTYTHGDGVMVIDHTEVDQALEGQGTGTRLVEKAVAYAREKDFKVDPLCPFAEVLFDRNSDWGDIRV